MTTADVAPEPAVRFTDLLSLVQLDGRWQIIAKVFHFDLFHLDPPEGAD